MDQTVPNTLMDRECDTFSPVDDTISDDPQVNQSVGEKAFPLALAQSGEYLRIASFKSGKGLSKRLGDLGLHIGSEVKVIHRQRNGSVVVSDGNNRIALGCGATQMIVVAHTVQKKLPSEMLNIG